MYILGDDIMYPYLLPEIFGYTIAMYDLLIVIGIFLMFLYISNRFDKEDGFTKEQTNKILILIAASLVFALMVYFIQFKKERQILDLLAF